MHISSRQRAETIHKRYQPLLPGGQGGAAGAVFSHLKSSARRANTTGSSDRLCPAAVNCAGSTGQIDSLGFSKMLFPFFLVLVSFSSAAEVVIKNEKCKHCQFLVETFQAGLRRTARDHFGGGDTAWEEKNLGKYATSETRLVEIHESLCKKKSLPNSDKFNGLSELEFKCAALLEENEEFIEEYYYKHQESNAEAWLCIQQLKLCCPDGHYGPDCSKCPAVDIGAKPCFAHGQCHGDGSRKGTGKCKCDAGYVGNQCRHCDADYFEVSRTETTVECQKCYEGCTGGCTAAGPLGCNKCRSGWEFKEGVGCIDIDECTADPSKCSSDHEKCVNSIGSYSCECVEGYKREDNKCVIDFEATKKKEAEAEKSAEEDDEEGEEDDETEDVEETETTTTGEAEPKEEL